MKNHLLASVAILTSIACGGPLGPEDPHSVPGGDRTAMHGVLTPFGFQAPAGLIKLQVQGTYGIETRDGLVVAKDAAAGYELVLTSDRWVNASIAPSSVTAVDHPGTYYAQSQPGQYINTSAYFPGAIVQVGNFSPGLAAIDARASADLVGRHLTCYAYTSANDIQYVNVWVMSASGDVLTVGYPYAGSPTDAKYLEYGDEGTACRDDSTGTFVGFVTDATQASARLQRIAGLGPWLDGMKNLAAVRNGPAWRLSLYRSPGTPLCLDIPWGSPYSGEAVNEYPCHYGPSQRFWLDYSVDSQNPRLVSDSSGLCIDVPGASTASGTALQQYPCHTGANQRFDFSLWNDGFGGWRVRPLSAVSANLCLSAQGGPTAAAARTEERMCWGGTADQRWYLSWQ